MTATTRSREEVEADLRALQAEIIEEFGHLNLTVLRSRAEASGLAAELRAVAAAKPTVRFPTGARALGVGAGPIANAGFARGEGGLS
ncbi:MAG TPA: hypothetical protein PKG51_11265 [Arachnia sp.]|nr:hypothetical protein [Arachnia sp.]